MLIDNSVRTYGLTELSSVAIYPYGRRVWSSLLVVWYIIYKQLLVTEPIGEMGYV